MKFLFLFLDGVGLNSASPGTNPLAQARMPHLQHLLDGRRLVKSAAPHHNKRATLLALDANLGVPGLPQSATGQASLVTGRRVPAELGYHYGPKPNAEVAGLIRNDNLFKQLGSRGRRSALLNAYPPRYFEAIQSGRRLYSAIPLAVTSAGIPLKTAGDLLAGEALSADFTNQGWRDHLGFSAAPLLTPEGAGERLADLAGDYDLAFYEVWLTDYAGHMQDMQRACEVLETFDRVLSGLLANWDDRQGLILITSDHGNLEDLGTRRHTNNPVPGLVVGDKRLRDAFTSDLADIAGIAPAILQFFPGPEYLS